MAISSPEGTFAVPLTVLEHQAKGPAVELLGDLMQRHGAEGLVIGLPLCMDGSLSSQTLVVLALARRIAAYLGAALEVPQGVCLPEQADAVPASCSRTALERPFPSRVLLWDERLSSWEAQRSTRDEGSTGRRRSAEGPQNSRRPCSSYYPAELPRRPQCADDT